MLINFSNHKTEIWSDKQLEEAINLFSEVTDLEFPQVPPEASSDEVKQLADNYYTIIVNILKEYNTQHNAVHIMGEMTLSFYLISKLLKENIRCVASTTQRIVEEDSQGRKVSSFSFVRFRDYIISN